jgi:hypothetical protein
VVRENFECPAPVSRHWTLTKQDDLLGVEFNKELADLAESWGMPIARKDLLAFLRKEKWKPERMFT